jgi:cytidine deaminase
MHREKSPSYQVDILGVNMEPDEKRQEKKEITNDRLIGQAASVLSPKKVGDYLIGDVGCALVTDTNHIYRGVCIDVGSGMGFCAEHSAIAAMITAGEYRIQKIVAVWKNEDGVLHILSPCGRCREFIRQIHPNNIETDVILDRDKMLKLAELLPYHTWYKKQVG